MKIHKKSLLIGSATLVLLGGCSLFNTQNTSQKTESETTTTEISKADLAKFEKIAEEVKENKPKTIVGEVFENGYLKNMETITILYTEHHQQMLYMNKRLLQQRLVLQMTDTFLIQMIL